MHPTKESKLFVVHGGTGVQSNDIARLPCTFVQEQSIATVFSNQTVLHRQLMVTTTVALELGENLHRLLQYMG
jgi:hypothetical protein